MMNTRDGANTTDGALPHTPRYRNAPNFFLLGGAKCGTTTLYHLLRQVDGLYLPDRKEPRFFGNTAAYERGIGWYLEEYFKGAQACPARGEATPQYLHGRGLVAERVRACLGADLKFVVLLRDPVQRAWSHYLHMRRLGTEELPFREALAAECGRLADNPESWFGYFSDGLYAAALREWFGLFPKERFLILLTDELRGNPRGVVERVCGFIGVEPPAELELHVDSNSAAAARSSVLATVLNKPNAVTNALKLLIPYNVRQSARDFLNAWNRDYETKPPPLPADIEQRLRRSYESDIEALERMTGFDLGAWSGSRFRPRSLEARGPAPSHPGRPASGGPSRAK